MQRTLLLVSTGCLVLALGAHAFAQDEATRNQPAAELQVLATTTAERVRFSAPNAVVQLRLEVYTEAGQKLFDTEQHGGSVLDWHLQDGTGARLGDGAYLCVLTIKDLSKILGKRRVQAKKTNKEYSLARIHKLFGNGK